MHPIINLTVKSSHAPTGWGWLCADVDAMQQCADYPAHRKSDQLASPAVKSLS